MPRGWTSKDKRQYKHIKKSSQERGRSEERAQEIASRTVNKQRRLEGRTPNKATQGTGNPKRPLQNRSARELRNLASAKEIKGRSTMNKAELVKAIRAAR
jgi:hypothetical protein